MGNEPAPRTVVLREDDPQAAEHLGQGWVVTHRSWGARLALPDEAELAQFEQLLERPRALGYTIRQMTAQDAEAYVALEANNRADYPGGLATAPSEVSMTTAAERLRSGDWLLIGAWDRDGHLVAATANYRLDDRWEVDRTSVLARARSQGLATAIKARSIIELYCRGVRRFGTGGAAENTASLAMNRRLGFELEPVWLTLVAPESDRSPSAEAAAG